LTDHFLRFMWPLTDRINWRWTRSVGGLAVGTLCTLLTLCATCALYRERLAVFSAGTLAE
jgi:hypothetical protein